MIELTPDNTIDYLRRMGWIDGSGHVEPLSGGVSNFVLRVVTPERVFVLKQSRPQLRTRDAWFSDLDRIHREQEVMQALHPHLPDVVPEVLHVDRVNYVYAMSHAPRDATVWKSDLLEGRIDLSLGAKVGQVLGLMHQISADQRSRFEAFRDHHVYVQLRVEPFYVRVQERCPDVAAAIQPIIDEMLTRQEALCHGDYTPKNILIHPSPLRGRGAGGEGVGFTLVDYETAHLGDPTMDLGLFLAHLTLKSIRAPEKCAELVALMRTFWQSYAREATFRPLRELEHRGVKHLGVCLLARIDGTSPVDYLPDESKREAVRQIGRAILRDGVDRWEDVWQYLGGTP
ncbi:MAG: aminoglycoside phosphotransferase family protein [Planctomycetes bacterium]|nr:aminoglycoside phosphotransferase family protein [Planctomycetota bacterium]